MEEVLVTKKGERYQEGSESVRTQELPLWEPGTEDFMVRRKFGGNTSSHELRVSCVFELRCSGGCIL